jgi:cytochrome c-type biogenesis protein CcmH/NrfG
MRLRLSLTKRQTRARDVSAACFAVAVLLLACACGGGAKSDSNSQTPNSNASGPSQSAVNGESSPVDPAQLDAEIERLAKLVERNPGDDDTRDELARAYVKRGNWHRTSGGLQEALLDYQRALRLDPDNDAAQNAAAETEEQIGGAQQQGENGEPAPLPITPNVTDEEGKPTPTPKKQ